MTEEATGLTFTNVPIPPSSNNQYSTIIRGNRPIHVPALSLRDFHKEMAVYFQRNWELVKFGQTLFNGKPLAIHSFFAFEYSRLYTKAGNFKRLDVSNRLKALHDAFAKALCIDDSAFVHLSAAKYPVKDKKDEGCRVDISVVDDSGDDHVELPPAA